MKVAALRSTPARASARCALVLLSMLLMTPVARASTLSIGERLAEPGELVFLPVAIANIAEAVGVQLEINFDETVLQVGDSVGIASPGHMGASALLNPGVLRALVYSQNNDPLGPGTVIEIPFTVALSAPIGKTTVTSQMTLVGAADATLIAGVASHAGFVEVLDKIDADLSITNDLEPSPVAPGRELTYTIVVSNSGPEGVSGALVLDDFPPELTDSFWNCSASGGGTCSSAGTDSISEEVDLPAGATVTFTATGSVTGMTSKVVGNVLRS